MINVLYNIIIYSDICNMYYSKDTIVALSTAPGGALCVIRVSGKDSISIVNQITQKEILAQLSHTTHLNYVLDEEKQLLDEVMISVFYAPKTFTKENIVEIATHGSTYIIQKILSLLTQKGARLAEKGEFTLRAFLNGRLDLTQAEAIADLITAENEQMHTIAIQQMRGGFSQKIKELRQQLIHFTALMELELDFAEEDVEFADRKQFTQLLQEIIQYIQNLRNSFRYGNAIKKGVPIAIIGKPNAGKSTLLNALLEEEKAIVSPIAGTTRDVIEDVLTIQGIDFRFMDTAGLRDTIDTVEQLGVAKTLEKIQEAQIILYVCSANSQKNDEEETVLEAFGKIQEYKKRNPHANWIIIANKADIYTIQQQNTTTDIPIIYLSAKEKQGIDTLKQHLYQTVQNYLPEYSTALILTNQRHYDLLSKTQEYLQHAVYAFEQNISTELISIDIKHALHYLGQITGEISTDDILSDIFTNFCIGK
jgi:tRNA modification GTPase